jgi:HEPN domain-containing protein
MDKDPNSIQWLKRAKSNLLRAKQPKLVDVFYEDLCFDAQQAAEKSLKALLCFYNIQFRFVHDIGELIKTLENNGVSVNDDIKTAVILSTYAVETRYPSLSEPITAVEYNEAVLFAERVYNWVEGLLSGQMPFNL